MAGNLLDVAIVALAGITEKMKYADVPAGLSWVRYYFHHCWLNGSWVYVIFSWCSVVLDT